METWQTKWLQDNVPAAGDPPKAGPVLGTPTLQEYRTWKTTPVPQAGEEENTQAGEKGAGGGKLDWKPLAAIGCFALLTFTIAAVAFKKMK